MTDSRLAKRLAAEQQAAIQPHAAIDGRQVGGSRLVSSREDHQLGIATKLQTEQQR